jgi:hypothetical protein
MALGSVQQSRNLDIYNTIKNVYKCPYAWALGIFMLIEKRYMWASEM